MKQLTRAVLKTALDQEMTEHQGHEKNGPVVNETGNVRNGTRPKTVLTESTGEVGHRGAAGLLRSGPSLASRRGKKA